MSQPLKDQQREGVYFIYAPQQSKIKIGRSNNMPVRHKQLQTGFMDEGILLCGIVTNQGAKLENKLHRKFRHLRADGEWFVLTKELVDYVMAIETQFQSVILYHDLKILGGAVAYSDLRMFNYVERAKTTLFKIVIPLLFLFAGVVIAYYFTQYNRKREMFYPFGHIISLIVIPIITVVLPRMVVQYCSFRHAVWYFCLIAANMMLAALSLTYLERGKWFSLFQFVAILSYVIYARQLLLQISLSKNDESRRKKVADAYALNESQLFSHARELSKAIQRRKNVFIKAGIVIGSLTYVALHIVLFISNVPQPLKILILIILNTGVVFSAMTTYHKIWPGRRRSYILAVTTFLIIVISSTEDRAFVNVFFTLMPGTIAALAFLLWYSIKKRQTGAELDEIEKRLKQILSDREEQITILQRELKIIQGK